MVEEQRLWSASASGRVKEVQEILKTHPEINVNWRGTGRSGSLHVASRDGHVGVVRELLGHPGINPNLKKSNGETALLWACFNGRGEVASVLARDERVDVNEADNEGHTPLYYAAGNGHLDTVGRLLEAAGGRGGGGGGGVDLGVAGDPFTDAIGVARERRRKDVVELLERYKADREATRAQLRQKYVAAGAPEVGRATGDSNSTSNSNSDSDSLGGQRGIEAMKKTEEALSKEKEEEEGPPSSREGEGDEIRRLRDEVRRLMAENEELRGVVRELRGQLASSSQEKS